MDVATTTEQREAVFRFWYSVYVEEMGRYREVADHAHRQLRGPEDDHSRIFYARDDGEVVAACRFSWGAEGFSERQIVQYQLEPFLREVPHEVMLIGERTMVAASHRGGSVYVDLAYSTTPMVEELGILLSFGASEPHLVSYYAQFGQRPFAARQYFSEESGYIIPTLAIPKGLDAFGDDPPACIRATITGSPTVRNAAADGAEQYVAALQDALGETRPGLLGGLTDDEIRRVAARGTLITCASGDQILRQGGTARNPFLVVSGRLEVQRGKGDTTTLEAGDLFGESGWLGDTRRQNDVFVVEESSRILALSDGVVRKLPEADPSLAAKVHSNVSSMLWSRLRDADRLAG
jgi:hypothetical protein